MPRARAISQIKRNYSNNRGTETEVIETSEG
jgi:hypothetical protein